MERSKGSKLISPADMLDALEMKRFYWALFALLAVGLLWLGLAQSREPSYQGITITRWIDICSEPTNEVINAFGPSVARHLAEAMRSSDSWFYKVGVPIWRGLPRYVQQRFPSLQPFNRAIRRSNAARWLTELGTDGQEAIPEVMHIARHDSNVFDRCIAMNVLSSIGQESPQATEALVQLLGDTNVIIQDGAALAVGRLGTNARPAVRPLIQFLNSHPGTPYNPIYAFGQIGPMAEEAVPHIVRAAANPVLEGNAIHAFNGIGPGAAAAVPLLIRFLEHTNDNFQRLALDTLRQIGPPAQAALPALSMVKTNGGAVKRILAAVAIANIEGNPESALPLLLAELNRNGSGSWQLKVRSFSAPFRFASFGILAPDTAAWFLGDLGPQARDALPTLKTRLKSDREWERLVAARAIWRIRQEAAEILPIVLRGLSVTKDYSDKFIFYLSLHILTEMGSAAKPAATKLAQFVESPANSWSQRKAVLKILQNLDPALAEKSLVRSPLRDEPSK